MSRRRASLLHESPFRPTLAWCSPRRVGPWVDAHDELWTLPPPLPVKYGKKDGRMQGLGSAVAKTSQVCGSTAIALISMRYSGEVIFVTSTIVEAGAGGRKYSRLTL